MPEEWTCDKCAQNHCDRSHQSGLSPWLPFSSHRPLGESGLDGRFKDVDSAPRVSISCCPFVTAIQVTWGHKKHVSVPRESAWGAPACCSQRGLGSEGRPQFPCPAASPSPQTATPSQARVLMFPFRVPAPLPVLTPTTHCERRTGQDQGPL